MLAPSQRLVKQTCDYEGFIPPSPDIYVHKHSYTLHALTRPRPESRGRIPASLLRETQNASEIKHNLITGLRFAFIESHSPALRTRLIHHIEIYQLVPGDFVYRTGETNSYCFFLLQGELLLFAGSSSQPLCEMTAGASFGPGTPFSGERRRVATIVAKTPAVLGRLDFVAFNSAAYETADNDIRFLRRLIANVNPFSGLDEKDYIRLQPITKIARLTNGQTLSVNDKVAILCDGEIYGYSGDDYPIFFADHKILIPCGVLDEIKVISASATLCLVTWSDFRNVLVSDIAKFYDALVKALESRFDSVRARWFIAQMKPDFNFKVNQAIADITEYVRKISDVNQSELPTVAHAAWVSALRRIDGRYDHS
jgi:CRP-like cAMP-binding protein